jgi:hypothetical protein
LTKTKSIDRPQTRADDLSRAGNPSPVQLTETQLDRAAGGATFVERKAGDKTNP